MLLDEGADKGLVDLQGMTAKDHAKEKECVTIIGKERSHCFFKEPSQVLTNVLVDKMLLLLLVWI